MPVGEFAISVQPEGLYRSNDTESANVDPDIEKLVATSGLAKDVAASIFAAPDNASSFRSGYTTTSGEVAQGPAVIFAAHASKNGTTTHVSLALASSYVSGVTFASEHPGLGALEVRANDVRYVEYELHPERIFAVNANDPTTVFEPFAAADRSGNADGTVSADELRAVALPIPAGKDAGDADGGEDDVFGPPGCSGSDDSSSFACVTLLDRIADNAQHVLLPIAP